MSDPNAPIFVNVRVVTPGRTIFEGNVNTKGHIVNPESGDRHLCDGTNGHENPLPGPTCTSALDDAALQNRFTWDGIYDKNIDDYFVTKIGGVSAEGGSYWSLWLNFKSAPVGGGQLQIKSGNSVLWALVPKDFTLGAPSIPLKLNGPRVVSANTEFTVTVTDGSNRSAVRDALVNGQKADKNGTVKLTLPAGNHELKATRKDHDDIASNTLKYAVQ